MIFMAWILICLGKACFCLDDPQLEWILIPREDGAPIPISQAKPIEDDLARFLPRNQIYTISAVSSVYSWIVEATREQSDEIRSAGIVGKYPLTTHLLADDVRGRLSHCF